MKKGTIIFFCLFTLIGCENQEIGNSKGSIEEKSKVSIESTNLVKQDTSEDAKQASYKDCLLSGECAPEHNNENATVEYKGRQFEATFDNSSVKVKGEFSSTKTPFPEDERNWGKSPKWITKLEITINNNDVFLPVLTYMDMSPPENLYFREQENEKILILRTGNDSTLLNFTPIVCEGLSTESFEISERLDWYIPMFGDSVQHISFQSPNCN